MVLENLGRWLRPVNITSLTQGEEGCSHRQKYERQSETQTAK